MISRSQIKYLDNFLCEVKKREPESSPDRRRRNPSPRRRRRRCLRRASARPPRGGGGPPSWLGAVLAGGGHHRFRPRPVAGTPPVPIRTSSSSSRHRCGALELGVLEADDIVVPTDSSSDPIQYRKGKEKKAEGWEAKVMSSGDRPLIVSLITKTPLSQFLQPLFLERGDDLLVPFFFLELRHFIS